MDMRERIVQIIRAEYSNALYKYERSYGEYMGLQASARVWAEHNPDDGVGGFSSNPYKQKIKSAETHYTNDKNYVAEIKEAYDFAVDTFLSQSKPQDTCS